MEIYTSERRWDDQTCSLQKTLNSQITNVLQFRLASSPYTHLPCSQHARRLHAAHGRLVSWYVCFLNSRHPVWINLGQTSWIHTVFSRAARHHGSWFRLREGVIEWVEPVLNGTEGGLLDIVIYLPHRGLVWKIDHAISGTTYGTPATNEITTNSSKCFVERPGNLEFARSQLTR